MAISFSVSLEGARIPNPGHGQCLLLMDSTAGVDQVGCGEDPEGRGRERDEREVVEVRQGEVSDISGLEERLKCG